MRHTCGPKHIPVCALNRILVAHHQRGQHTGQLAVVYALKDRLADRLPRTLNGVRPGCSQLFRGRIARPGTHVARRLQVLLPKPQLVVKPMRVAVAVRRLEPHRHLPAFASPHGLWLALQLE